ncbi:MAG: Tll0287-like domain-containing protein, partial [Gammaproteobacteria bacterium]
AFFGDLKGALVAAIQAGGPVNALNVCNAQAPAITAAHSKPDLQLARTSLKLRNPANAPDAWEKSVLEKFEARKAAGEDPMKMEYHEVVEMDGKQVFRYMKAIPTAAKPCLACHGEKVAPGVEEKLKQLYPADQARGYKAGDIRGAFTIKQPM